MNDDNNVTALYVYSPTTFKSDKNIEPMAGTPHAAGEVHLSPGIYRLTGGANIVAANGAHGSSYSIVPLGDTKGTWPDPPLQAIQQHNTSADEIKNFLSGTGVQARI